jgi:hypothetical protein
MSYVENLHCVRGQASRHGCAFILSTGDQCGCDMWFENIHAMVETARTYGVY